LRTSPRASSISRRVHRRRQLHRCPVRHERRHRHGVAVLAGQGIDVFGGLLEAFVLLQPAHEVGARIVFQAFFRRRARQEHARLDLGQDGGHDQVFGGELEAHLVHRLDVVDVLARDFGDRDVEDVQVLAADQVQQQVQRAFEGVEDDLERIRRDVQVLRDLQDRLAKHHRQRHLLLLRVHRVVGRVGAGRRGRVGRGHACFVGHAFAAPSGPLVVQCGANGQRPGRGRLVGKSLAGGPGEGRAGAATWRPEH
jgi:hypothetical protein